MSAGRRVPAALAGLAVCALGLLVWAVGLGRYLEDYCFTRVGSHVEAGGPGPRFASPVRLRCDYADGTALSAVDIKPLIWTLVVVAGVLVAVGTVWVVLVRQGREAGPAGRAFLAVVGVVLGALPVIVAVAVAVALAEPGPRPDVGSPRDAAPWLLLSAGLGVGAAVCLREALGRRAWSPWLLLGLVPATWQAVGLVT